MPPTVTDINRVFRDHVRYTGDGQPNAPVNSPLPTGSPMSGIHNATKKDIRDVLIQILQGLGDPDALDLLITEMRFRKIVHTGNANFINTNFGEGVETVIFRNSSNTMIWQRLSAAPAPVVAGKHQQDVNGQWWERVFQALDTTPSYASRAAAEAGAALLPTSVTQILVLESGQLVLRSRTAFADDPLYPSGSRWGVMYRSSSAVNLPFVIAGGDTPAGVSVPVERNFLIVHNNTSRTVTFWRFSLAPADGVPTSILQPDGSTPVRWWAKMTDSTVGDLQASLPRSMFAPATGVGGTANTITGTYPTGVTGQAGHRFSFKPVATNTGNVTFNNVQIRLPGDVQLPSGYLRPGRDLFLERGESLNVWYVIFESMTMADLNIEEQIAAALVDVSGPIRTVAGQGGVRSIILDASGAAQLAWVDNAEVEESGHDMLMCRQFWERGAPYLGGGGGGAPAGLLSTTALDLITVNGQSLSVGGPWSGSIPAVTRAEVLTRARAGAALMLEGTMRGDDVPITTVDMPRSQGYNTAVAATGLGEAMPSMTNVTSAWPMAVSLNEFRLANNLQMVPVLTQCHGISGVSADDMDNDVTTGTGAVTIWGNAMFVLDQAKLRAAAAGRVLRVPYHAIDHGTASQAWEPGRYLTWMWKYCPDYQAAVRTRGIQGAAVMLIDQCGGNANTSIAPWEVCDEQLQFCEAGGGVLTTPQYAYTIADDNVHPDAHATILYAEVRAWAVAEIEAGRRWTIKRPRPMVMGNLLVLTFDSLREDEYLFTHDPAKYGGVGIDTHLGFQVDGATITGSQVRGNQVILTCSAAPTGVRYAYQSQDVRTVTTGVPNFYCGHRGLLRTSLTRPSHLLPGQSLYRWIPSFKNPL